MSEMYTVSSTPHNRSADSTDKIMRWVIIALAPAGQANAPHEVDGIASATISVNAVLQGVNDAVMMVQSLDE